MLKRKPEKRNIKSLKEGGLIRYMDIKDLHKKLLEQIKKNNMRDFFLFVIIVFMVFIGNDVEQINDKLTKQNDLIQQQNKLLENQKSPNTLDTLYYLNPEQ